VERHLIKISFVMKIEYGIIYGHIYTIDLHNHGLHLALRIQKQKIKHIVNLALTSQRLKNIFKGKKKKFLFIYNI
jgi:hypothetical protein